MRSRISGVLTGTMTAVVVLAAATAPAAAAPASPSMAPLLAAGQPAGVDRYIVVLKPSAARTAAARSTVERLAAAGGAQVTRRYSRVLDGFAATLPGAALDAVRADPAVAYVERDSVITGAGAPAPRVVQTNPPSWGLDRIDQRNLPLDLRYNYETTGTGTTVFVVDSGIRASHTTFGGRASGAANFVADGNGTNDCHGHGTHVAGTVAGSSYGVAKSVTVRAVRVLDCNNSGLNSDLIAGMDWIAANHGPRSIANFSLQGYGTATNTAAERLLNSGVHAVFIANNFNTDACTNAPRSPRGLVVGASDRTDARAAFSSYGSCVDVFAPGVDIVSASHLSNTGSATFSGTSMAAPHVSGWVARYLQTHPAATMAAVKNAVIANATRNVLRDVGPGSPNRLLYSPLRVPARSGT